VFVYGLAKRRWGPKDILCYHVNSLRDTFSTIIGVDNPTFKPKGLVAYVLLGISDLMFSVRYSE
jgi:hypothetical protein